MTRTPADAAMVAAFYKAEVPLTRENYIEFAWAGLDTSNWSEEDEAQLPEELQDWSLFSYDADADAFSYHGPRPQTRVVD
jgi:hypothetical protein